MLKKSFQQTLQHCAEPRHVLAKRLITLVRLAVLTSSLLLVAPASAYAQTHESRATTLGTTASVHTSSQHTGVHRIDIFGTSSYRSVLHWVYQNDVLSAKEDLGGYLTSAPAAVVWTSTLNGTTTVISVFGRNAWNSISYRSFYRGTWTPWIDLGGVNFSSGPAVTSDGPNDIEMVARGSDNQIYMKNFSNSMWGNWFSLGGVNFTSAPAIASYGHGYWGVYARGGDYALWHKIHYNDINWWAPWGSFGGVLTSAPAAVSWGSNVNEVFVRNTNNTLSHISDANYYTPHWVTEDREIPENLAAASWESGGLDLFVRSDNGMLVHKSYTGTFGSPLKTVSDWTPLPAISAQNFAAAGW